MASASVPPAKKRHEFVIDFDDDFVIEAVMAP
jgi:hypothetical protein